MRTFKYSKRDMFYLRLLAKYKYKQEMYTNSLKIFVFITIQDQLFFNFYNKTTKKNLRNMDFYIILSAKDAHKIHLKMIEDENK